MNAIPQTSSPRTTAQLQQGCPAPAGTRLRSASALRKAGRTARGRFVMDPTHGCCRRINLVKSIEYIGLTCETWIVHYDVRVAQG